MPERRVSYAQNGEDVRIWRALRHVEQPFYVEVGASDPYDDSVTAALSAEGWRGVLLEPDTDLVSRLRAARPLDVVVAAAAHGRPGALTFDPGQERGLGTVSKSGSVSVPAVRVADVLDDVSPSAVHAMVIDVEGGELEALRGAELERWRPWVLCVEATAPNSRELVHRAWEPLVLDAGYSYVAFDGLNRWYVAEEHADLAPAVEEPLSVLDRMLDGWVRRAEVRLEEQVLEARRQAHERLAQSRRDADDRVAEAHRQAEQEVRRLGDEVATLRVEVERLQPELAHVAGQRDQALERETVMLRSKSWRVTAPLRTARWQAGLALAARRPPRPDPETPPQTLPGDDRRWAALRQRVKAAHRSRA